MLRLTRIRTAQHIGAAFRDPKRLDRLVALAEAVRDDTLDLKSSMWKDAKPALRRESGGNCAYCEAPASLSAHCDVEHFRPKSHYWWLALCYDNYVFACQLCNQVYKVDKFPIEGTRMRRVKVAASLEGTKLRTFAAKLAPDPLLDDAAREVFVSKWRAEKPLLVDPYLDDPADWFAWDADATLREVKLVPAKNTARNRKIVEACEDALGLNREELRQARFEFLEPIQAFADIYRTPGVPATVKQTAEKQLSKAMGNGRTFAGMVRWFVLTEWALPIPLPA